MKTRATVAAAVLGVLALAGAAAGQDSAVRSDTQAGQPVPMAPAAPAAPAATAGRPQLVFESIEHDFGKISDQNQVSCEFKFTNQGDGVLRFNVPLKASCGCTAGNPRSPKNPDVDQAEFAPGESGFIKVTFNPQGKHGAADQRVTVTSNDPQQPEQILKIHAFVRTTISFDPPLVGFGDVSVGEVRKQIVKVNGPAPDFKIDYASVSKGRYVTVKVLGTQPATIDGEEVSQTTLELTFNGTAPRGTLNAVTTVRTNNENFPLADLQVMAEVVGDLQVLPPRVNVGIIESGQEFSRVFKVTSRSGKPFKILNVGQRTALSPLAINVTPLEPGNETAYQVEVKGTGPTSATPISATLTLNTDNPTDRTVDVMLSGAVRPPVAPTINQQLQHDTGPAGPGAAPAGKELPPADRPH